MTVVLCILDGWGYSENQQGNAIYAANTPNWDRFLQQYPYTTLETSGLHVGLPDGQMGNSEVGHMNLGAGRVVMQDLPRIDQAMQDGLTEKIAELQEFISKMKASEGTVHLMGLLSPGGVHSHQNHILAMAKILTDAGVKVEIHGFLDGRDVAPTSAKEFVAGFITELPENAELVSVTGRFYAMDRDKRWERVEEAYNALVSAKAVKTDDLVQAIADSYAEDVTDEFVTPKILSSYDGMKDGDGMMMCNFRADRARQILHAFTDQEFDGFNRTRKVDFAALLGMSEYSSQLAKTIPTLFPPQDIHMTFGEVLSKQGKKQLRIAETEKYAHVTFFFNGGVEQEFEGEERILIPSPKVKTYDLQPEMSAAELTDKLTQAIDSGRFDAVVVNFANPDMVGHTGIFDAAVKAVEAIDVCLARIEKSVLAQNGYLLITADHGNVEEMLAEDGGAKTSHSSGPVPFVVAAENVSNIALNKGKLCDVVPTLLEIMKIDQPNEMTGTSLLKGDA